MNNKIFYKIFYWTFIILYLGTAFISYCHSIEFFNIGNEQWMSYILGAIFEIGQATVLAALLLTDNKKTLLPWLLMILLTSVQVIGNTYSVFKFMSLSETNYYIYLSKPLLFWIQGISQETVMIIIAWIIGAMLPIVALAMTSMVTNQLKLSNSKNENEKEIKEEVKNIKEELKEENKLEEKEDDLKNKLEEDLKDEVFNSLQNKEKDITDYNQPIINSKEGRPRVKSVEKNFSRY